jgi:hypothetical protein
VRLLEKKMLSLGKREREKEVGRKIKKESSIYRKATETHTQVL